MANNGTVRALRNSKTHDAAVASFEEDRRLRKELKEAIARREGLMEFVRK